MKASLIMTVYNSERDLPHVLNNIFEQEFKDFELIAVNDGSTDMSSTILAEYAHKDSRLKVVNQTNSGVGSARSKGLDIATGEYVGFVDCDDEVSPKLLAENIHLMEEYSADLVLFGYSRYYPSENEEKFEIPTKQTKVFDNVAFGKMFLQINSHSDLGFVWNKLINREFLRKYDIDFVNVKTEEDAIFAYNVIQCASTIISNHNSYYKYTMKKKSLSHHIQDLDSLESDIKLRRSAAKKMFNNWASSYNYVIGHNDVRLLDVGFRKIFQGKKLTFKRMIEARRYLRQPETHELIKILLVNFYKLTNKDKVYVLVTVLHLFWVIHVYNNR